MKQHTAISTRRTFLKQAAAAVLAAASPALYAENAMPDLRRYDFLIARLRFRDERQKVDNWNILPAGEHNLLCEAEKTLRCRVKKHPGVSKSIKYGSENHFNAIVSFLEFEKLRQYPFVFMTSDSAFLFDDKERRNLKQYIDEGGFLFLDDCVNNHSEGQQDCFFQCGLKILSDVFGADMIRKLPLDHELFHNVYDMGDKGMPCIQGINHGAWALMTQNRISALLSPGDLHCGWTDKDYGWYGPNGKAPGHANHDQAIQMGINIIMYALSH